jgi:hypothetical protein
MTAVEIPGTMPRAAEVAMSTAVAERPMAKERKNTPVRIDEESVNAARIACGYTGESMSEYISRIVKVQAQEDTKRLHAERFGGTAETSKGKATSKR